MVICSADVKSIKTELRDGNSIYQIRTISMENRMEIKFSENWKSERRKGKKSEKRD